MQTVQRKLNLKVLAYPPERISPAWQQVVLDKVRYATCPALVGVAANIDAAGEYHFPRLSVGNVDVHIEYEIGNFLHINPRDFIDAQRGSVVKFTTAAFPERLTSFYPGRHCIWHWPHLELARVREVLREGLPDLFQARSLRVSRRLVHLIIILQMQTENGDPFLGSQLLQEYDQIGKQPQTTLQSMHGEFSSFDLFGNAIKETMLDQCRYVGCTRRTATR